jgi:hypothetical protein
MANLMFVARMLKSAAWTGVQASDERCQTRTADRQHSCRLWDIRARGYYTNPFKH